MNQIQLDHSARVGREVIGVHGQVPLQCPVVRRRPQTIAGAGIDLIPIWLQQLVSTYKVSMRHDQRNARATECEDECYIHLYNE